MILGNDKKIKYFYVGMGNQFSRKKLDKRLKIRPMYVKISTMVRFGVSILFKCQKVSENVINACISLTFPESSGIIHSVI